MATQCAAVTGVDLSEERLEEARELAAAEELSNIEFVAANIYESSLPESDFDYVYCRFLLVHLARPADAIRHMFTLLKPGGMFVCEEPDLSSIYTEPPSEAYHRLRDLAVAAGPRRGVDYTLGRKLHMLARDCDFEVVGFEAYQRHFLENVAKRFWSWSLIEGHQAFREGGLSDMEFQSLCAGTNKADEDPNVLVGHARVHQLLARRSA